MLTTTQLQNFKAGAYTAVIEKCGQAAEAVNSASSTISGISNQMSRWTGRAAEQALATMGDLAMVVGDSPGLLTDAQDVVAAFVTAVSQQQAILNEALAQAGALGCAVASDGAVTPPAQPPGEPPQICYSDPAQEAARVRAQTTYDNRPDVQRWQSATERAPSLQAKIQEALRTATAADSRAARDLDAGIRGGTDVQKILAGKDTTGSYAADLYRDTQTVGDGKAWVGQFVNQATSLLDKAAGGDTGAVHELSLLTPLSYDADFAAALMNHLGATGLEKLPVTMGQSVEDAEFGNPAAAATLRQGDQSVLRFLADSLAAASNSGSLDPGFVQALTTDTGQDPDSRYGPGVGFWALGQILGASSGSVQYDPQFLDGVGSAIIAHDKELQAHPPVPGYEYSGPFQSPWADNLNLPATFNFWQANEPAFFGVFDSGSDPVYGLMHAAAVSPQAGLALFSSNNYANLNYLMNRPWTFDHGSALGSAIAAAGDQPGHAATALSAQAIRDYMPHLGQVQNGQFVTTSYNGGALSGVNAGLGQVLGYHMNLVYDSWARTPDSGAGFFFPTANQGLPTLLAAVSSDPAGYRALLAGAVVSVKLNLQAVAQAGANAPIAQQLAQFNGMAKTQGNFLGFVVGTHNGALAASGLQQDQIAAQNASQEAMLGNFVNQGIGLIPIPGSSLAGSAFKTILGDVISSATSPSASDAFYQDALAAGGANWGNAQNLMAQMVGSSMISKGLWLPGTDPATWLGAHPGQPAFFTTTSLPDGQPEYHVIPPGQMNAQQYGAFVKWSQGGVGYDQNAAEGSVGSTVNDAAGSVNDGITQATQQLNAVHYPANP